MFFCLVICILELDKTYLSSPKCLNFLVKGHDQEFTLKKFQKGKRKRLSIYVVLYLLRNQSSNTNERIYKQSNSPVTVPEFNPTKVVSKFIRIAGRKQNNERCKNFNGRLQNSKPNIFQRNASP